MKKSHWFVFFALMMVMAQSVVFAEEQKAQVRKNATRSVEFLATLDIDDNGRYDLIDVRLLFNYLYGGKLTNDLGNTRMLIGTPYKNLTGTEKATKAAEFRETISDMVPSLDIDDSDKGNKYDLIDIRLIANYIMGGSRANAAGDKVMISGTPYTTLSDEAKAAKAAEFRARIAEMLE